MLVSQMARTAYISQQVENKLRQPQTSSEMEMFKANQTKIAESGKKDKAEESVKNEDTVTISKQWEESQRPEGKPYGLYMPDGTFISQEDKLAKVNEIVKESLRKSTEQRAALISENPEILEEMAKQSEAFAAMSDPALRIGDYAASASNMMNERLTVTFTIESEQESERPDHPIKPPHHHGWHHFDGDHHHRPPYGDHHRPPKDDQDSIRQEVTLTFVKSFAVANSPDEAPPNAMLVNGEYVMTNSDGDAMVVMPDDTIRYVSLTPEILEQIDKMNREIDGKG